MSFAEIELQVLVGVIVAVLVTIILGVLALMWRSLKKLFGANATKGDIEELREELKEDVSVVASDLAAHKKLDEDGVEHVADRLERGVARMERIESEVSSNTLEIHKLRAHQEANDRIQDGIFASVFATGRQLGVEGLPDEDSIRREADEIRLNGDAAL